MRFLNPIQLKFVTSEDTCVSLLGKRRSGKTYTALYTVLYQMLTKENISVVYAGPYKTHVDVFFSSLKSILSELEVEVVKDIKAPYYELRLSNGSRIRGFSTASGVAAKGQDADLILLEEAQTIDKLSFMGIFLPMLHSNPKIKIRTIGTFDESTIADNALFSSLFIYNNKQIVLPLEGVR